MAQTGNFTPILLYSSSTTGNTPGAANLLNSADGSEMAINIADGRLFYKDTGGAVQKIADKTWIGTVTSVAALTLGTTGTDLSSTVANGTSTPVITLNVPTASSTNRGALSSTDWSTFNGKQVALVSGTNIKTVGGVSLLGSGDVGTIGVGYGGTGQTSFTAGRILFGNGSSAINSSSGLTYDGTAVTITYNDALFAGGFSIKNTATTGAAWARMDLQSGSNASFAIYQATNGVVSLTQTGALDLAISTNNAERLRVFSSGGVSIGNTTDPGAGNLRFNATNTNGIYFGSSSILADYEEGTWTPTFVSSGATFTYAEQYGSYVKVGKLVTLQMRLRTASASGTLINATNVGGIPFTSANLNANNASAGSVGLCDVSGGLVISIGDNESSIINLWNFGVLAQPIASTISGKYFIATITYRTA